MAHAPFESENSALLLIDHQVGTMGWVRSVPLDEIKMNTLILAKAAAALGMPVVLTSSMEEQAQGPLMPELESVLPEAFASRVIRGGIVNCWEDESYRAAVMSLGRRQLIMAGITTDVCLAPPAISAAAEGLAVQAVVDASGSPTVMGDDMAFRQMEAGGVRLTTTNALVAELAKDWASSGGGALIQILAEDKLSKM